MTEGKEDNTTATFTLKNTTGGFAGRSSNVFAGLDALEQQHIVHEQSRTDLDQYANLNQPDDDLDIERTSRRGRAYSDQQKEEQKPNEDEYRRDDRQSQIKPPGRRDPPFRRPRGRAPGRNPGRRNWVPDHGSRPQNWTYYSLEDVKGSEMSERSNTQAALAFIDERRKQREQEERDAMGEEEEKFDVGSAACSKGLFSFAKRRKHSSATSEKSLLGEKEQPSAGNNTISEAADERLTSDPTVDDAEDAETTVAVTSSVKSATETTAAEVKPSFKNRKGIKRSIRTRDDD